MIENLYKHIIDTVNAGIIVLNQDGCVATWNSWMDKRSGLKEPDVRGTPLLDVFPELKGSRIDRSIYKALELNCPSVLSAKLINASFPLYNESIISKKNHQRIIQSILIKPLIYDNQQCCVISIFDISSSDLRERALRTQSAMLTQLVSELKEKDYELKTIFDNTQNAIVIFDNNGLILNANPAAEAVIGIPREDLTQRYIFEHIDQLDKHLFSGSQTESDNKIQNNLPDYGQEQEMILLNKQGHPVPIQVSFNIIPYDDQCCRYYIFFRDITEQKKAEEKLYRMARYDSVTGLYNRATFLEKLQESVIFHQREGRNLSVFFIDLDRFKNVNDTLGHNAGDAVLKMVAERIGNICRNCDTLARWAGDEFILLLENQPHQRSSITVAEKIIRAFQQPFAINNTEVYVGCSIGISQFPDDQTSADGLVSSADQAMYQSKREGKGVFRFFTRAMNEKMIQRLKTESELRQAITQGEFILQYQPQVGVIHGDVAGVEALVRWQHPEKGLLAPDEFIGIAEDCGLISDIGDWVMQEAISMAAQWEKRNGQPLIMSINLSPRQFLDDALTGKVKRLLDAVGLDASHLVLEITENDLISDRRSAYIILESLKALGVKIAIDDFGTGYSSLAYLRTLPVDILKIDREFVINATENETDSHIIAAIIDLAHALKLEVIAEGIESISQLELLKTQQCDMAQGYYIGKPMALEHLQAWHSRRDKLH